MTFNVKAQDGEGWADLTVTGEKLTSEVIDGAKAYVCEQPGNLSAVFVNAIELEG